MNVKTIRRSLVLAAALVLSVVGPQTALASSAPAPARSNLPSHAGLVGDSKVMKVGNKHVAGAAATSTGSVPVLTNPMTFHGGQLPYTPDVITTPKVYIDFWGSGWTTLTTAQAYITSFFTDVGGSGWANVDTQYQGAGGATVSNVSSLGGVWNDVTNAIPSNINSGSSAVNTALGNETAAAVAQFDPLHHFTSTNNLIVIATPSGVAPYGFPTSSSPQYCAFHSAYYPGSGSTIYPNVLLPYLPDVEAHTSYTCYDTYGTSGLSGFSIVGGHEFAEAITDTDGQFGWFNDVPDTRGQEIGDLCDLGHTGITASNVTLQNTHSYYMQPLFSNSAVYTGYPCVFGYSTTMGAGYNILTSFGGIYSYGDAKYYGNLIDHGYPGPAIGFSEMPLGDGYQILTTWGGIYGFGSGASVYYGNLIDHGYPGPAVATSMTPTGKGYAILTSFGGIYTFGDAKYYGNLIDHGYPGTAVSIAYDKTGLGYQILTASGAMYTFGDAKYYGNLLDHGYPGVATSIADTEDNLGYTILTTSGAIYTFGDAAYFGNLLDHGYPGPAVALAQTP